MDNQCTTSLCFQIIYMALAATAGLPQVDHFEPSGKAELPYSHFGHQHRSRPSPQHHKTTSWIATCLCVLHAEIVPSRDTPIATSTTWLQCC